MSRPKRDLKALNINIPTVLSNKVESYAIERGMTKTDAICQLVRESLDRQKETV